MTANDDFVFVKTKPVQLDPAPDTRESEPGSYESLMADMELESLRFPRNLIVW